MTFSKGPQLKKIPKISVSCQNFLDPLPHYLKFDLTNKNAVKINYKFWIFGKFQTPLQLFWQNAKPIMSIDVAPNLFLAAMFCKMLFNPD